MSVALSMSTSCTASAFQCTEADDCAGRPGGVCETTGYCSFPDDECPSGRRYGEFSQGSLAGACVLPDDAGSTSSVGSDTAGAGESAGSTGSRPSTLSGSSGGPGGSGTTADPDPTTGGFNPTDSDPSSSSTASTGSMSTESSSTESSSTGPAASVIELVATLAACTDPVNNDPAGCELSTETQGMSVDLENSGAMGAPTTAFVAFVPDDELATATVLSAEVRLTATDEANAESTTQSGELWLTESFTLDSLALGQPALLGRGPIAPDQGAVVTSEEVTWELDPADVDTSSTVFVAVVPTTVEGVDYWNSDGVHPPVLRLTIAP